MLSRFGDSTNLNFMQRAFADCVETVQNEIEKRKQIQSKKILFDKKDEKCNSPKNKEGK